MSRPPKINPQQEDKSEKRNEVFAYKDSGIREKHGYIPGWLWLVAIVMSVWSVYYIITYWNPPTT